MILVDTSVLIDFFKGTSSGPSNMFREVLEKNIPFGITAQILQEILQGSQNEKEFNTLKDYLVTQNFYFEKNSLETFVNAAQIYQKCRKKGITIRSTIDCLIAQIAIEHKLLLLHNDNDFIRIAEVVPLNFYK